eukprot:8161002-Pyramimonas_sp.AAC.1
MKAATKGGSGKTKGIDYSDLLSITKSTMKKTTRGAFTSKAYDNTKKRASVAGMSPAKVLVIAREAYAAAASKWDKLKITVGFYLPASLRLALVGARAGSASIGRQPPTHAAACGCLRAAVQLHYECSLCARFAR